jgi:hypothetical protein
VNILPTSSGEYLRNSKNVPATAPHRVPRFSSVSHANPRGRYQRQVGHDPADAVTMVTRDSHITGLALPCAIDTHIRGQHALWRAARGQVRRRHSQISCLMFRLPSLDTFRGFLSRPAPSKS